MPYVFTLDGKAFNTDDLTLDEAEQIEEAAGESWVLINPFRSVKHFKAIAKVALKRDGWDEVKIGVYLDGLTITEALNLVEIVANDLPASFEDGIPDPKADEEPTGT